MYKDDCSLDITVFIFRTENARNDIRGNFVPAALTSSEQVYCLYICMHVLSYALFAICSMPFRNLTVLHIVIYCHRSYKYSVIATPLSFLKRDIFFYQTFLISTYFFKG